MCKRWLLTDCADHAIGRARATLATLSTWTLLHRSVNTAPRVDSSRDRLQAVWHCGALRATLLISLRLVCAICAWVSKIALVFATTAKRFWTSHLRCSVVLNQVVAFACVL